MKKNVFLERMNERMEIMINVHLNCLICNGVQKKREKWKRFVLIIRQRLSKLEDDINDAKGVSGLR